MISLIRQNLIYIFLAKWFNKFRRLFKPKYNIINCFPEKNTFGKKVKLFNTSWGRGSGANDFCEIANAIIGNYTLIGENVIIGARNHIHTNFTICDFIYSNSEFIQYKGTGMFNGFFNKIGDNVWIGRNCIINQGVEIGSNSIIAAGSVIVKSVPPYSMVGGNPAKIIKYKFNPKIIDILEKTKWYELDQLSITKLRPELENIVEFSIFDYKKKNWKTPKKFMQ